MCLNKKNIFPKRAKEDIIVWKKIKYIDSGGLGNLEDFSYWCMCRIEYEIPQIPHTIKSAKAWWKGIFRSEIEGEGVHAWCDKPEDEVLAYNTVLVKCKIPKGSMYYESINGDFNGHEIAAEKIVLEEVVRIGEDYSLKSFYNNKGMFKKKKKHGRKSKKKGRKS